MNLAEDTEHEDYGKRTRVTTSMMSVISSPGSDDEDD